MKGQPIVSRVLAPLSFTFLLFATWVAILAVPGAWLFVASYVALIAKTWCIVIALAATALTAGLFWWRHWQSGVATLCGIAAVALLASAPDIARSPARWVAELMQLIYFRGDLLRQERQLKDEGVAPAIAVVATDGFGSMTSGLALDRTGEILLPPQKRSASWKVTGGETEVGIDGLEAHRIVADYYWWFHF